ncbi:MAG: pilus assembly protein [Candidatus Dormibacteraeota bacterium]|nr:pilus assembly protein [Candidatus Dormibacteraeota bacterium]
MEFAFVAPLFFVCFLSTIDAGIWAVQSSAEVSAVQQAARLAAAAGAAPVGAPPPDAGSVTSSVRPRLQQALFATSIVPWTKPGCPQSAADVERALGPRVVALCVQEHDPPRCSTPPSGVQQPYPLYCTDTPTVTVRLIGHVAALVPPGVPLGAGGEMTTDLSATTHTLRFAP